MRTEEIRRVERIAGRAVARWVKPSGGYTPAERFVVSFDDGSSTFVKLATNAATRAWIRDEHRWTSFLDGRFAPRVIGFDDGELPLLLLEDLSRGHWPPPWRAGDVERLCAAVAAKAAIRPLPEDLPALSSLRPQLSGWAALARDARPFLGLGICTAAWLEDALPRLCEAEAAAVLDGEDLVHFDVRSDNVCLLPDRVVLVDWTAPTRGPGAFDLACLAPSLRLEGGPLPDELVPDAAPYAALLAGYFASQAGLPMPPGAPRVRWIQLRQLRIALPWACRALGLSPPDWSWAKDATARLDAEVAAGRITDAEWSSRTEEIVADAYLSSADPRRQSGRTGDEADWQWSRELVLDAVPALPGVAACAILDVGCANGYLMESLARWGIERGMRVEPFGLEISPRLAALARARLPRWAERIWTGDVRHWQPPRRFDVVLGALDYAPPGQVRALVERILRDLVAPEGRLIIRPDRVRDGVPDVPAELRRAGLEPGGILEAVHPSTGAIRRSAWLAPNT